MRSISVLISSSFSDKSSPSASEIDTVPIPSRAVAVVSSTPSTLESCSSIGRTTLCSISPGAAPG